MNDRGSLKTVFLLALVANGLGVRSVRGADGPGDALPPARAPSLADRLDPALTPAQRAEKAFLEHLGWRFPVDPSVRAITVAGGTPCRRRDLAASQAAGDLRILVPSAVSATEIARFGATLSDVADSIPSRGAWQFLVGPAVERACRELSENEARGFWRFPQWVGLNSPIFLMKPPESSWVRREKICFAKEKPSAAIEAFYDERSSTECYVGQTIAAYATQYELYGAAWFDAVFAADEIAIGQVGPFHGTPLGRAMDAPNDYPWRALFLRPEDNGVDMGVVLGRLGPTAFPGLTGILMDQNGTGRSNQNLMFVSVSAAAADTFAKSGFGYYAERSQELLSIERTKRAPFVTGARLSAGSAREAAILSEPGFREVRVFVHPYGISPIGDLIDRFRRRDHSALGFTLYDEAREDVFFQRYRKAWKDRWSAQPARR